MSQRSKRLEPIARIAGERERRAARTLADDRRRLRELEERCAELERYRDEYAERGAAPSEGSSGAELKNYQRFMDRLDRAIAEARARLERARERCERRRRDWVATRAHAHAIENVISRHRHRERRDDERREQQQLDEHAERMGRARNPSSGQGQGQS